VAFDQEGCVERGLEFLGDRGGFEVLLDVEQADREFVAGQVAARFRGNARRPGAAVRRRCAGPGCR
jgi:hypothetical protein